MMKTAYSSAAVLSVSQSMPQPNQCEDTRVTITYQNALAKCVFGVRRWQYICIYVCNIQVNPIKHE